jgi:hypothetical protein
VLGSGLFFDDVLEQEIPGVRIRALAVHRGAPARELRHVLVVLGRPRPELGAIQLAPDPLLRERIQAAVAGDDGGFEPRAERALAHGFLLGDAGT